MKRKLFIASVVIILGTPLLLLGRWAYENNQVVSRARELQLEISRYPGATFQQKYHSITNLGYGEIYSVNDDPEEVLSFFKSTVSSPWQYKDRVDVSNSKALVYKYQDFTLDISVGTGKPDFSSAKPPYNLYIDISQVPGQ